MKTAARSPETRGVGPPAGWDLVLLLPLSLQASERLRVGWVGGWGGLRQTNILARLWKIFSVIAAWKPLTSRPLLRSRLLGSLYPHLPPPQVPPEPGHVILNAPTNITIIGGDFDRQQRRTLSRSLSLSSSEVCILYHITLSFLSSPSQSATRASKGGIGAAFPSVASVDGVCSITHA